MGVGVGGGVGFRLEERDRVLPEMCKYVCDTIFVKSNNNNEKSLISTMKKKVSTKLSFYAEPLTMYPLAVRLLLRHLQRRGEGGKRQRSSPIKQFDSSPLPVNAFLPPSNHFLVHKSLGRNLVDSSSGLILPCGGDR